MQSAKHCLSRTDSFYGLYGLSIKMRVERVNRKDKCFFFWKFFENVFVSLNWRRKLVHQQLVNRDIHTKNHRQRIMRVVRCSWFMCSTLFCVGVLSFILDFCSAQYGSYCLLVGYVNGTLLPWGHIIFKLSLLNCHCSKRSSALLSRCNIWDLLNYLVLNLVY